MKSGTLPRRYHSGLTGDIADKGYGVRLVRD